MPRGRYFGERILRYAIQNSSVILEGGNTMAATQEQVDDYIRGAEAFLRGISRDQLISMVILHFDIPDAEAKMMVELSLKDKEYKGTVQRRIK